MIFDAKMQGYESQAVMSFVKNLKQPISEVVFINIHYLTTKAFIDLVAYLKETNQKIMISDSDLTRVFPPLFEFVSNYQIKSSLDAIEDSRNIFNHIEECD